ncbi:hypothetical protein V5F32_23345 [Xanthobacter oligotrophicus]|uniref:Methylase-associated X1 domain-containing protein n=1 Tax=Xanthobacter oligotrophicus TaxID=2607286 RepID=A0ABW7A4Y7_9HYPH
MILGLRHYATKASAREPLLRFMLDGLRAAGCRVLFASPPDRAPFVITFETRDGERMGIVAYAFLATRTPTRNRPADERSFQIKYGSKADYADDNAHVLWQDPLGLFTTLLIGIDPKEGFFVAVDPEAHNPTKFFIRVEFKDEHAEEVLRQGWHAWERTRRAGPMAEPVEVLVGGTRDAFLDLVRFERAAYGLAPGDRQLLADKRELIRGARPIEDFPTEATGVEVVHPLLRELSLGAEDVLELIAGARRLKMAVRGWVAEEHLRATLAKLDGITHCERLDVEGAPDLLIRYKDGPQLTVECKNVLRVLNKTFSLPRIDFQRTRAAKGDPCSRYYAPSDFDVVAGCLHAVTERWEFRYAIPTSLDPHQKCPGKLASNVLVDKRWVSEPALAFEAAAAQVESRA